MSTQPPQLVNTDPWGITYLYHNDTCPDCGKDTGKAFMLGRARSNPRCNPCNNKAYAQFLKAKGETSEDDRYTTINDVIPPRFQGRDQEWIRKVQPQLIPLLDWKPNREGRGYIIDGPSDSAKTTAVFMLLEELIHSRGYKPVYVTAVMLGMDVTTSYGNTARNAKETIMHYATTPILFIDDLGKEVIKERFAEAMFEIMNIRGNYCRPTFITSQYSSSQIQQRFDGKTEPEALLKRIYGDMDRISLTSRCPRYQRQETL
jgi:hypothetical protein